MKVRSRIRSLKHWLTRHSPALIALAALVGLGLALAILFRPDIWPDAGATMAERGNVSSAVATVFALFAAILAVSAAVWVTTSDYRAAEDVKKDTVQLRATLQSIRFKAKLFRKEPGLHTFEPEVQALHKFLLSTTAFGFRRWVEEMGEDRRRSAGGWPKFFFGMTSLLDACERKDRKGIFQSATELEDLFIDHPCDLGKVSSFASDLAGTLGTPVKVEMGGRDELAGALGTPVKVEMGGRDEGVPADVSDASEGGDLLRKLQHLRKKGVIDPNVDLFLAVFDNDVEAVKTALAAGADTSVTDRQVLAAHQAELRDFDPTARP